MSLFTDYNKKNPLIRPVFANQIAQDNAIERHIVQLGFVLGLPIYLKNIYVYNNINLNIY